MSSGGHLRVKLRGCEAAGLRGCGDVDAAAEPEADDFTQHPQEEGNQHQFVFSETQSLPGGLEPRSSFTPTATISIKKTACLSSRWLSLLPSNRSQKPPAQQFFL